MCWCVFGSIRTIPSRDLASRRSSRHARAPPGTARIRSAHGVSRTSARRGVSRSPAAPHRHAAPSLASPTPSAPALTRNFGNRRFRPSPRSLKARPCRQAQANRRWPSLRRRSHGRHVLMHVYDRGIAARFGPRLRGAGEVACGAAAAAVAVTQEVGKAAGALARSVNRSRVEDDAGTSTCDISEGCASGRADCRRELRRWRVIAGSSAGTGP